MQINTQTSQQELDKLYRAVTRRELLQSTPLNIKMFMRYAVLFVLFPGMIGGFRVGVGATLVFCLVLVSLLSMGMTAESTLAVRVWLGAGVCVLAWVSLSTVRAALKVYHTRNSVRSAENPPASQPSPREITLRWRKSEDGEGWLAESRFSAPHPGIYALMLRVQDMGRRRLLTSGRRGVCCVQSSTEDGGLQALLLYRLEKGEHCLRWTLIPRRGAAPASQLGLLNQVDGGK